MHGVSDWGNDGVTLERENRIVMDWGRTGISIPLMGGGTWREK